MAKIPTVGSNLFVYVYWNKHWKNHKILTIASFRLGNYKWFLKIIFCLFVCPYFLNKLDFLYNKKIILKHIFKVYKEKQNVLHFLFRTPDSVPTLHISKWPLGSKYSSLSVFSLFLIIWRSHMWYSLWFYFI